MMTFQDFVQMCFLLSMITIVADYLKWRYRVRIGVSERRFPWEDFVTPSKVRMGKLLCIARIELQTIGNDFQLSESFPYFANNDELVVPSFQLSPALKTRDIQADLLNPTNCRFPAETRLGTVREPSRHDAFRESTSSILGSKLGLVQSSICRTNGEILMSKNNDEYMIPLIERNSHEFVDERLSVVSRANRAKAKNETVHVGPIVLKLINYGSREANLCQAGCLLDARHGSSENSILGAYMCRVNNEEQILLFFPGSTLPLNPHINESLKIKVGISNLDLQHEYQLMQSSAIVQTWKDALGSKPTAFTRKGEDDEMLVAQRFKTNHCQVISKTGNEYKPLTTKIDLGRSFSLRQIDGGTFGIVDAPRRSVLIRGYDEGQGSQTGQGLGGEIGRKQGAVEHPTFVVNDGDDDVTYPEMLVDVNNETSNLIHQELVEIDLTANTGTLLMELTLENLLINSNQKATQRLRFSNSTNCTIRVKIEGGQGPLIGGAICGAYADGLRSWTAHYGRIFNVPHFVMNPFVEESLEYWFRPLNCLPAWSPQQCVDMPAVFGIFFVGPFTNPPKNPIHLNVKFYVDTVDKLKREPVRTLDTVFNLGGKYLGDLELKQGERNILKRFPIYMGNPSVGVRTLAFSQSSALANQFAAVKGKIILDVFVHSSPLIKGFVQASIVMNPNLGGITISYLLKVPNLTRTLVPGNNVLEFDLGSEGIVNATTCAERTWSETMQGNTTLVIWSLGGVSSHIDGSFHCNVSIRDFVVTERYGYGLTHKLTYTANNVLWKPNPFWHNVFYVNFQKSQPDRSLTKDLDLYGILTSMAETLAAKNDSILGLPADLVLLRTTVLVAATVHIKFVWSKTANTTQATSVHTISASLFPFGSEAMPTDHIVCSDHSGSVVFKYDITGPFGGMRFVAHDYANGGQSGKSILRVTIDNPRTIASFAINVMLSDLKFGHASSGFSIKTGHSAANVPF